MRRTIHIMIPIVPQPKRSTRSTRKHRRQYKDEKTRHYEDTCKEAAKKAMGSIPPIEGAVYLNAIFYMPIPESWSKKRKTQALLGKLFYTKRPDKINLTKSAEDILNEIAFLDDKQIVAGSQRKLYSDNPRLELTIIALEDEEET